MGSVSGSCCINEANKDNVPRTNQQAKDLSEILFEDEVETCSEPPRGTPGRDQRVAPVDKGVQWRARTSKYVVQAHEVSEAALFHPEPALKQPDRESPNRRGVHAVISPALPTPSGRRPDRKTTGFVHDPRALDFLKDEDECDGG